jgi:ATP-dependent protease ClpP protease subunit
MDATGTSSLQVSHPFPFEPDVPWVEPAPLPRSAPVWVPTIDRAPVNNPQECLYDQRRVFVSGPLDSAHVASLAASLLALDGLSADPVEVIIFSSGGPMSAALVLLDVMAVMRARVDILCIGPTVGTAAIVAACSTGRRRLTPNATLALRFADEQVAEGSVHELTVRAEEDAKARAALMNKLSAAVRQPVSTVEGWFQAGLILSAVDAVSAGLLDDLVGAALS